MGDSTDRGPGEPTVAWSRAPSTQDDKIFKRVAADGKGEDVPPWANAEINDPSKTEIEIDKQRITAPEAPLRARILLRVRISKVKRFANDVYSHRDRNKIDFG